jgi:hypothetical protein
MGGRSAASKSASKPVLPHDVGVHFEVPEPEAVDGHVSLEGTPGALSRLSDPEHPPKRTEPHEIETALWLRERGIKFKWFNSYNKDRTSPDIFIGNKSVDMKALFPENGEFNTKTYNGRVRSGLRQSRRLLIDATRTDASEEMAIELVFDTVSDFGAFLDEFVILVKVGLEKIAIGWHRA